MSINWNEELDKIDQATKPITLGDHDFRVVEAKKATASTGNEMIKLTVKVEGGPDDGKLAYVNLVFAFDKATAMKMTTRRLHALGLSDEWLRGESPSLEQIAGKLMGRLAKGTVTHRDFRGEMQNDVDFMPGKVSGPSAGMPPPTPILPTAQPAQMQLPVSPIIEPPAPPANGERPF